MCLLVYTNSLLALYVPTLPCFLSFFLILYMYDDRTQNTEIRLNSRDSIRDILHKTTLFDSSIERGILRRSTNGVVSSPFLSLSVLCASCYPYCFVSVRSIVLFCFVPPSSSPSFIFPTTRYPTLLFLSYEISHPLSLSFFVLSVT